MILPKLKHKLSHKLKLSETLTWEAILRWAVFFPAAFCCMFVWRCRCRGHRSSRTLWSFFCLRRRPWRKGCLRRWLRRRRPCQVGLIHSGVEACHWWPPLGSLLSHLRQCKRESVSFLSRLCSAPKKCSSLKSIPQSLTTTWDRTQVCSLLDHMIYEIISLFRSDIEKGTSVGGKLLSGCCGA